MKSRFTVKEHVGAGLAVVLLLLLAGTSLQWRPAYIAAIGCIVLLMAKPAAFFPFTLLWLNLSVLLGKVVSRIILAIIFLLVVSPTGLVRRIFGKDSLGLRRFGKSDGPAFHERRHRYAKEDLLHPY